MQIRLSIASAAEAACQAFTLIDDSTSSSKRKRGGSYPGKAPNKDRDNNSVYRQVVADYFSGERSIYDEFDFERRFRVNRDVFTRVYETVLGHGKFVHSTDVLGKRGIHPLVRTVAFLLLVTVLIGMMSIFVYPIQLVQNQ
jgi:hypothetical protein